MDEPKDIRFLHDKASLFQYYANSRNNIEDPLFTGFTLVLDELHSPLFKSLIEPDDIDTLRSPDGQDSTLADMLEEKLNYINRTSFVATPDTYEMNTMFVKDTFNDTNRRRPGYGLFDKYYMENLLYGAPDYIYMVDKISDSAFTDTEGVSNLGNGSPSTNIYEQKEQDLEDLQKQYEKEQIEAQISPNQHVDIFFNCDMDNIREDQEQSVSSLVEFLKNNPESKVQLDGYASKDKAGYEHNMDLSGRRVETVKNELIKAGIDASRITIDYYGDTVQPFEEVVMNRAVTCQVTGPTTMETILKLEMEKADSSITDSDYDEYTMNEELAELYRIQYEDAIKKGSEYGNAIDGYEKLEESIKNQLYEIQKEFTGFTETMKSQLEILSGTGVKTDARTKIESTYEQFKKFCEYFIKPDDSNEYKLKFPNISAKVNFIDKDQVEKFDDEIKGLREELKKAYDEGDKEFFTKCWSVLKSSVSDPSVKEETEKLRQEYKKKLEELNEKLYGKHPDGRIGTKENPTADSLYGKYANARKDLQECAYTKKNQYIDHLNDLTSSLDGINEYKEANKDKVTEGRALPVMDIEMTDEDVSNPAMYEEKLNKLRNTRVTYEVPQTYYDMMNFIKGMKKITKEYPYVFQSITGLDEAYNAYFEPKDAYMGSGDNKISIECLEFLDLRVSTMFNRYFNAVYDRQYRRERVPINLRRFQCSIFVHDIRNFKDSLPSYVYDMPSSNILKFALNYISAIEFKFFDCEIVPTETGNVFDSVSNVSFDMKKTKFTFTYGNCMINFLPFEDIKRYILNQDDSIKIDKDIPVNNDRIEPSTKNVKDNFKNESDSIVEDRITKKTARLEEDGNVYTDAERDNEQSAKYEDMLLTEDGNFRRWFDKSDLGNVNNNDYRDYIRHDSAVAVDDHFKTTIVNDFANNSVGMKNKELTAMDDALRKIVVGISASTGIPVKGVTDALNIKFIDPILNEKDLAAPIVKNLGNANNSTIVDAKTTEYIGTVIGEEKDENKVVSDLGNVEKK